MLVVSVEITSANSIEFNPHAEALLADDSIPFHFRALLSILLEDRRRNSSILSVCNDLVEEVKTLRAENQSLRQMLGLTSPSNVSSTVPCSPPYNPPTLCTSQPLVSSLDSSGSNLVSNNIDYSRDVIFSGVVESCAIRASDRVAHDLQCVRQILDFLGIECKPSAVYRMGRGNPRILKVSFPASRFAFATVKRAPMLNKSRLFRQIHIRHSLPREVREKLKADRLSNNLSKLSLSASKIGVLSASLPQMPRVPSKAGN